MPPEQAPKWSRWVVGLQLIFTFLLGLALRGSDPLHLVLATLYPPQDSLGGIGIVLTDIAGRSPSDKTNIFLIRHEFDNEARVTLIRRGGNRAIARILAGITERTGRANLPEDAINSASLVDLDLAPRALVVLSVTENTGIGEGNTYALATASVEKGLQGAEDLEIKTLNEARNTRFLYYFSMALMLLVGLGSARYAKLTQIAESHDSLTEKSLPSDRPQ